SDVRADDLLLDRGRRDGRRHAVYSAQRRSRRPGRRAPRSRIPLREPLMSRRAAPLRLLLLAAAAAVPALLPAQERGVTPPPAVVVESLPPSNYPWLLSYYPLIGGGLGGGPVLVARVRYFQPSPTQARSTYPAHVP